MAKNGKSEETAPKPAVENTDASQNAQKQGPRLNVARQYIKDLSFEIPNAPASFTGQQGNNNVSVRVDVSVNRLNQTDFEVSLKLDADATDSAKTLFKVELIYAGIFQISGVADNDLQPVTLIECPRILFPFARHILSSVTQQGSFPPLLIDPIDFAGLYRARMQQLAQAQANENKVKN